MPPPLVIANWKMHTTLEEALTLVQGMVPGLGGLTGIEIVLCPPFPWLTELSRLLVGTGLALGAQNMHFDDRGGFTGEVSPLMLKGLCRYVLLGHAERRVHFHETDWLINQKLLATLRHGLTPVLCVGETADQLEHGETAAVVSGQLEAALKEVVSGSRIVVAYDPVWGTMGMASPPTPRDINEICGYLRQIAGDTINGEVRVLYGGPVTSRNIEEVAAQPEVDGVLVGSASLRAEDFVAIGRAVARIERERGP